MVVTVFFFSGISVLLFDISEIFTCHNTCHNMLFPSSPYGRNVSNHYRGKGRNLFTSLSHPEPPLSINDRSKAVLLLWFSDVSCCQVCMYIIRAIWAPEYQ